MSIGRRPNSQTPSAPGMNTVVGSKAPAACSLRRTLVRLRNAPSFLSHGLTRHQRPGRPCCVGYSAGSSSPAQRPAALPSPRLQPPPRQLVAAASAALPSLLALVRPAPSCRRAEADNSVVGRAGCGGVAWSGGGSGGGKSAVGGEDGGSGGAHGVHHRAGAQGGGDDQLHERCE